MNYQNARRNALRGTSPQRSTPSPPIQSKLPTSPVNRSAPIRMSPLSIRNEPSSPVPESTMKVDTSQAMKFREQVANRPKPVLPNAIRVDMLSVLRSRKQSVKSPLGQGTSVVTQSSQSTSSPVSSRLTNLASEHPRLSIKSLPPTTAVEFRPPSPIASEPVTYKDMPEPIGIIKEDSYPTEPQSKISMKGSGSPVRFASPSPPKVQSPISVGSSARSLGRKSLGRDSRPTDVSSVRNSMLPMGLVPASSHLSSTSALSTISVDKPIPPRRIIRKPLKNEPSSSSSDDISSTDEDVRNRKMRKQFLIGKLRQTESAKTSTHQSRRREKRQWHTENEKTSELECEMPYTSERKQRLRDYEQKSMDIESEMSCTSERKQRSRDYEQKSIDIESEISCTSSRKQRSRDYEQKIIEHENELSCTGERKQRLRDYEQKAMEYECLERTGRSVLSLRREHSIVSTVTEFVREDTNYTLTRKPVTELQRMSSMVNDDLVSEPSQTSVVNVESNKLIVSPITDILHEQTQQFQQQLEEQKLLQLQLQKQQKIQLQLQKQQQELQKQLLHLQHVPNKDGRQPLAFKMLKDVLIYPSTSVSSGKSDIPPSNLCESVDTVIEPETPKQIGSPTSSMIKTVQEILNAKQKLKSTSPSYSQQRSNMSNSNLKLKEEQSLGSILSIKSASDKKKTSAIDVDKQSLNQKVQDEQSKVCVDSTPTIKTIYSSRKAKESVQSLKTKSKDWNNDNQSVGTASIKSAQESRKSKKNSWISGFTTDDQSVKSVRDKKTVKPAWDRTTDIRSIDRSIDRNPIISQSIKKIKQSNRSSGFSTDEQSAIDVRYKNEEIRSHGEGFSPHKEESRTRSRLQSDVESIVQRSSGESINSVSVTTLQTNIITTNSSGFKGSNGKNVKKKEVLEDEYSEMSDNRYSQQRTTSRLASLKVEQTVRGKSLSPMRGNVKNTLERKASVSPKTRMPVYEVMNRKRFGGKAGANEWKEYESTDDDRMSTSRQTFTSSDKKTTSSARSSKRTVNRESEYECSDANQSKHQFGIRSRTGSDVKSKKSSSITANIVERARELKKPVQSQLKYFFNEAVENLETFMEIDTPTQRSELVLENEPGPSRMHVVASDRSAKAESSGKVYHPPDEMASNALGQKKSGKWRKPVMQHEDRSMTDAESRGRRHTFEPDVRRKTKDDEAIPNKELKRKMMAIERDQRLLKLKKNLKRDRLPDSPNDTPNSDVLTDTENKPSRRKEDMQGKPKFMDKYKGGKESYPSKPNTPKNKPNLGSRQEYQSNLSESERSNRDRRQMHGLSEKKFTKPQMTLKKGFGDVEDRTRPNEGRSQSQLGDQVKYNKNTKMKNVITDGGEEFQYKDKNTETKEKTKERQSIVGHKVIDSSDSLQNAGEDDPVTTSLTCMGDTKSQILEQNQSSSSTLSATSVASNKTIGNQSESSIEQMMLRVPSTENQTNPSSSQLATAVFPEGSAGAHQSNVVRSVCNLSSTFKKFISNQGNTNTEAVKQPTADRTNENEEFAVAVVSKKSNWINQNVVVQSLDKISSSLWHLVGGKKKNKQNEEQEVGLPAYLSEEEAEVQKQPKRRHQTPENRVGRIKPTVKIDKRPTKHNEDNSGQVDFESIISPQGQELFTVVRVNSPDAEADIVLSTSDHTSVSSRPSHFAIAVVNENTELAEAEAKPTETIISNNLVLNDINTTLIYLRPINELNRQNDPSTSRQSDSNLSAKAKSIVSAVLGATGRRNPTTDIAIPGSSTQNCERSDTYTITVVVLEPMENSAYDNQNWQANYAIERTLDKLQTSLKKLGDKPPGPDVSQERNECERMMASVDDSMFSVTMILMDPGAAQGSSFSPNIHRLSPTSDSELCEGARRTLSMSRITSWSQVKEMDSEDFGTVIDNVFESPPPYLEPEENKDFLDVDIVELELKNLKKKK